MRLLLLLMLAAVASAAPKDEVTKQQIDLDIPNVSTLSGDSRSLLVNALIRSLFVFLRNVINNGWAAFNIPVLDPLEMKEFNLTIPAGLINLDLQLKNVLVEGFGGFVVHRSNLNLRNLTFDIDISFPVINAQTEQYDLVGDLFTAIPLYGKGGAVFNADGFRFRALLYLKQSQDEKSIIIDRIENAGFDFPHFKSELSGVIGGGDIDAIVNALAEDVLFKYVTRFHGAIAHAASSHVPSLLNPFLEQLDTWKFISPLLPRNPNPSNF